MENLVELAATVPPARAAIAVALGSLVDVWTTNRALKIPGNREANPIMQKFMAMVGKLWWLPKIALTALMMWAIYLVDPANLSLGWMGLAAFLFGAALWNLTVINKTK